MRGRTEQAPRHLAFVALAGALSIGCSALSASDANPPEDALRVAAESDAGVQPSTAVGSPTPSGSTPDTPETSSATSGAPQPSAIDASTPGPDAAAPVDAGCPVDLPGPSLVRVPSASGGSYCIDATEVTQGDYARFLAAQAGTPAQAPPCDWNTTFVPMEWGAAAGDAMPAVGVDWCDALAYCAWADKRLCGRIGGGAVEYTHYADADQSQWYNACSAGGTKTYPYGDSYRGSTCNGFERGAGHIVPVGEMNACEGGYPGLFDLSGNVEEWEDACDGQSGADDQCQFRGGSYNDSLANARLNCDFAANSADWFGTRASSGGNLGFRCCRD